MCRYMNHIQSLKFEHKLYAVVKEKMEEMQLQSMSWIEVMAMDLLLLLVVNGHAHCMY